MTCSILNATDTQAPVGTMPRLSPVEQEVLALYRAADIRTDATFKIKCCITGQTNIMFEKRRKSEGASGEADLPFVLFSPKFFKQDEISVLLPSIVAANAPMGGSIAHALRHSVIALIGDVDDFPADNEEQKEHRGILRDLVQDGAPRLIEVTVFDDTDDTIEALRDALGLPI